MVTKKRSKDNSLKLHVKLLEAKADQEWPELAAYLYNRANRLIAKANVKPGKKPTDPGTVDFEDLEVTKNDDLTVKIGLRTDDIRMLSHQRVETRRLKDLPSERGVLTFRVENLIWICWIKTPFLVTGTADKWVNGQKKPICVGKVDIYDVDVRCFLKLPDSIIERIRDSIVDVIIDPPPFDIRQPEKIPSWWDHDDDDWCGTPPGPRPPLTKDLQTKLEKLPREWAFASERVANMDKVRSRLDLNLAKMPVAEKQLWLNSRAAEDVSISQVVYSNTQQFRTLLVEHFQVFRFWLCWYPWIHWLWWPWCRFYGLEKLGTATLQSDGSFSEVLWLSICRKDQPDLWFRVRQNIDGTDHVIYARYPVLCNTYWNHPSADPVNLLVTNINAVVCEKGDQTDKPGVYVMPLGIGNDGWYEIEQAHFKPGEILNSNHGLYKAADPYGTRLDIRMQFHDSLMSKGVEYFRWSYAPSGTSSWSYINTPVTHRYLTQVGTDFFIVPEDLGPISVAGKAALFKIPDAAKDWVALNRNDRAFAIWYTATWNSALNRYEAQVNDGRYILRLEMFDGSGNNIKPDPQWNFFLPTSDVVGGVWPVDDSPHIQPDGSVHFNIWVDNTDTVADIQSVGLGGTPTSECQFIEYNDLNTDKIAVTYVAYHKLPPARDFLKNHTLKIKRGISGTTVASHSLATYVHTPSTIMYDVATLLAQIGSKGPYNRCAFAVELHTNPRTRDGYSAIRQYEDHDTSAFALMQKP